MRAIIGIVLLFVFCESISDGLNYNEEAYKEWKMYKIKYGRLYDKSEDEVRRVIWEHNKKNIEEHNILYERGEKSYFLGVNQFTDMTDDEFKKKYLQTIKPRKSYESTTFTASQSVDKLPATVNWVTKGYVTPVKNQDTCGSCWAFSATGALEGQYFRKTKRLVSFSEMQMVECGRYYGTFGCSGGYVDEAYLYIKEYGIESEQDYKYVLPPTLLCKFNSSKVVTKVTGSVRVKSNSEESLAAAVATVGPISVGIDGRTLNNYSGGIYDNPNCSSTILDHWVLVVGYGVEKGKKYWLVKNSWGTETNGGYIKMSKDKNNQCGIATLAFYPTL